MGTASRVLNVLLRLFELISAVIVVGILSRFFVLLNDGSASKSGRIIYAEVIAVLGIVVSLILMPPLRYAFWAWPIDVLMFIMWLVAFSLLAARASTCSGGWFFNYWTFYWGRFWNNNFVSFGGACGRWRTVLAFLFMGSMAFLASAILGLIKTLGGRDHDRYAASAGAGAAGTSRTPMREKFSMRRHPRGPATQTAETGAPEGPAV